MEICFYCDLPIERIEDRFCLYLDRPRTCIYFHMNCFNKIKNDPKREKYLQENKERIFKIYEKREKT